MKNKENNHYYSYYNILSELILLSISLKLDKD